MLFPEHLLSISQVPDLSHDFHYKVVGVKLKIVYRVCLLADSTIFFYDLDPLPRNLRIVSAFTKLCPLQDLQQA